MTKAPKKPQIMKTLLTILSTTALFLFIAYTYKESRKKAVAKPLNTPLAEVSTDEAVPLTDAPTTPKAK